MNKKELSEIKASNKLNTTPMTGTNDTNEINDYTLNTKIHTLEVFISLFSDALIY